MLTFARPQVDVGSAPELRRAEWARGRDGAALPGRTRERQRSGCTARETILVADDGRVVVELLSLGREAHGFTVARAADGMQVIMTVRRAPPAAILLDLMTPSGTGFDVLTRLHSNAAMKSIPVIAMSASLDREPPHKALQSGADAFPRKPVEQEKLLGTVRGVLEKRKGPSQENS